MNNSSSGLSKDDIEIIKIGKREPTTIHKILIGRNTAWSFNEAQEIKSQLLQFIQQKGDSSVYE